MGKKGKIENLTPHQFKPGESGNPKGRPKGKSLTTILSNMLDSKIEIKNPLTNKKERVSIAEGLAIKLIYNGLSKGKNNIQAIKEIMDRTEGKALQNIVLEGDLELNAKKKNREELIERLNQLEPTIKKPKKRSKK